MYCTNCGAQIPDDSVFCTECGYRLDDEQNGEISAGMKKKSSGKGFIVLAVLAVLIVVAVMFARKGREGQTDQEEAASAAASVTDNYSSFESSDDVAKPDEVVKPEEVAKPDEVVKPDDVAKPDEGDDSAAQTAQQADDSLQTELDTEGIDGIVDINSPRTAEDMDRIASKLSTDKVTDASDFGWFMDLEGGIGTGEADFIRNGEIERIMYDQNPVLNGGWSAFMADTMEKPFDPLIERFFTVDIDTEGDTFNMSLQFDTLFMPHEGTSYKEEDSYDFTGTWDQVTGTASAQSDFLKVEFDNFYLSEDECAEIAVGTFYWNSGEVERIALIRYSR